MKSPVDSSQDPTGPPEKNQAAGDDYSTLTGLIAAVSQDQAQLRLLVYEFARRKLRRQLYQQFEDGDWDHIQKRMRALEEAIEQVEINYVGKDETPSFPATPLTFPAPPPLTYQEYAQGSSLVATQNALNLGGRLLQSLVQRSYPVRDALLGHAPLRETHFVAIPARRLRRQRFWWRLELGAAALIGVVIFAFIEAQGGMGIPGLSRVAAVPNAATPSGGVSAKVAAGDSAQKPQPSKAAQIPMPTEYGAYALVGGKLTELAALPMRVPDARVAISAAIPYPSHTHMAAGKLSFVVYRRDLANSVPERVNLRVVAQVVRSLTFDPSGKAITTNVEDTWVVRSKSYEMRVAPVADNPEMIIIRPENPDFAFPAGRYALVLKTVAYDFTIDGPMTDAAHCLERADALVTPVYSECRNL